MGNPVRACADICCVSCCVYNYRGSITQICCHFKTQKVLSVSRNKEIIVKFVINYYPSSIKPSITASGQRQSRSEWIET